MLSLLNAQCLNININLAYKSPFGFVLVFYFLTSIASKLVDLLTCLNPHRPVQSQSRGDHNPGIRDHPRLPWLYRNSTEKRKKGAKHKRGSGTKYGVKCVGCYLPPEASLSELLWSSLSIYFFFFRRFLFPSLLPFFFLLGPA